MIDFTLGAALALFLFSLPVGSTDGGRLLRKAALVCALIGGGLFLLQWGLFELRLAFQNSGVASSFPAILGFLLLSLFAFLVLRVRAFLRDRQRGHRRIDVPNPRTQGKDWSRPEDGARGR